jgi:murein DD-endopeptidase MepM/ murein hydrolase activator NlpD
MKRNRLIRSAEQQTIFSSTTGLLSKYRQLALVSLVIIISIFITNIVFATNEAPSTGIQSQVISLPGQAIESQQAHFIKTSSETMLALPVSYQQKPVIAPDLNQVELSEINATEQIVDIQIDDSNPLADESASNLDWQEITVQSGDNLSLLFSKVGLTATDVYNVAKLKKQIQPLLNIKPGQVLRFGLDGQTEDKQIESVSLQQLELIISPVETFQVSLSEKGYQVETIKRDIELRQKQVTGSVETSLFEAGLTSGLSDKTIMELAYIFGWDIDFALDIRQGDHFKVIYHEHYLDGDKIDDGDILAAEFTNRGKTFRAIRFADVEGSDRYYSPEGNSMRKAFNRTPVHFSRISSGFNPNRKHPVLKTSRPHRGVDYAAATGTPILATGDGKVDFVGTKGGYGRTVVLSHGGKYTTLYAHMSRYRKGIKRGMRIKQGQTIGYIGSSGLATGPHLHYEFRVDGVHRNPLTVTLPKAEPLPKKYRADFAKQAQPLLAQLDTLQRTSVAINK